MGHDELVVRGGVVVDGTGEPGRRADVLIARGRVVDVGPVPSGSRPELDAEGCVVAPGFINVLSHAYGSLQQDARGLSDLYQGVTTEVFGEGYSLGPVLGRAHEIVDASTSSAGVRMAWPRLNDFLDDLASNGVGPNVASFVGAHNLRAVFAGTDNRPLTPTELRGACALLDEEIAAGALGLGSSLLYAPGAFASTEELLAYCRVLARSDALYISHVRDEAQRLPKAIAEVVEIARGSSVRAEIYHLKVSGRDNWSLMATAIDQIEEARREGLRLTADVYPYEAASTDLAACIPPWYHEGGEAALLARLRDPVIRSEISTVVSQPSERWENIYHDAGGAGGVLLHGGAGTAVDGRTLAEVSVERGTADPVQTLMDLVIAKPDMGATYFCMTEDNIRLALRQPWVSVGSDSEAAATEPPFVDTPTHPRAYGSFARVLGRYVREGVLGLEEAVRRMTSLPADNLRLSGRGQLRPGGWADLAVFDAGAVQDLATYRQPHRYAAGMRHVVVNGTVAFEEGHPTGRLAGRALRRGVD